MRWSLILALTLGLPIVASAADKKALKANDTAPEFQLRDRARGLHRLSTHKEQVVLLDFFRTDCIPCLKAIPELRTIHAKYAKKGLVVVMIALLEEVDGRAALDRFLAKERLPFRVLVDPTEYTAEKYLGKTISLPATFLVGRDGKITTVRHGGKTPLAEVFDGPIEAALAKGQ